MKLPLSMRLIAVSAGAGLVGILVACGPQLMTRIDESTGVINERITSWVPNYTWDLSYNPNTKECEVVASGKVEYTAPERAGELFPHFERLVDSNCVPGSFDWELAIRDGRPFYNPDTSALLPHADTMIAGKVTQDYATLRKAVKFDEKLKRD